DLDGLAARGRRDRALPPDEPRRIGVDRDQRAHRQLDAEPRHEPGHRVAQPAAVLALRRTATAATAAATGPAPPTPAGSSATAPSASASQPGADRERRVRRLELALDAVRERVLVDGRLPALGHRLQHPW